MAEQLKADIPGVTDVVLIPGKGGVFEVTVDGTLVYSKKATGRHAEYEEVAEPIRAIAAG